MNKKRILIVDDEHLILKSLEVNLRREHFDVYTASDVKEALNLVQRHHFHVILSDYHLGELTGIDLFEKTKVIAPDTKLILFSGHDEKFINGTKLSEKADLFLSKPFDLDEILEGIQNV